MSALTAAIHRHLSPHEDSEPLLREITNVARCRTRRTDTRLDQDEVAQEAVIAVWQLLPGAHGGAEGIAKLVQATISRKIADARRALYRRAESGLNEGGEDSAPELNRPGRGYAEILAAAPTMGRKVIDLLLAGYTVEETAGLTGQTAPALRSKIARTRETVMRE